MSRYVILGQVENPRIAMWEDEGGMGGKDARIIHGMINVMICEKYGDGKVGLNDCVQWWCL